VRRIDEQNGALALFAPHPGAAAIGCREIPVGLTLLVIVLRFAGTTPQRLHFIPIFFRNALQAEGFKRIPVSLSIISMALVDRMRYVLFKEFL